MRAPRSRRRLYALALLGVSASCGTDLVITDNRVDAGAEAGAGDAPFGPDQEGADDGGSDVRIVDPDVAVRPRIVFVTALKVTGDMQPSAPTGRAGGDALCMKEAAQAGLDGGFVAWLSLADAGAVYRLPDDDRPWALRSGAIVFPRRGYIQEAGTAKVPIVETADGATVQDGPDGGVFSCTSNQGGEVYDNCASWTATTGQAQGGYFGDAYYWCWGTYWPCNEAQHLLCFEQ